MPEVLVRDVLNGSMPLHERILDALADLQTLADCFPETVIDLCITSYPSDPNKLYFAWWTDAVRHGMTAAYIGYDEPSDEFFDLIKEGMGESQRFTHEELMEFFEEKFRRG